jgi:uncharacterized repeat protein (TIGR01451 family)
LRRTVVTLAALLFALSAAAADFSTSTLTSSAPKVYPLDTVDYVVTVRNSGATSPNYLQVASPIPVSAMYVASSPDWKFDAAKRELSWFGRLPPGTSQELRMTLLAMPETEGNLIAARVPIRYDGSEWNLHRSVEVDTRPAGRAGLTGCGWVIVAFAGLFAVVLLFVRRGPRVAAVMWIFLSAGFLLIFVWIARDDARIARSYRETRCTVLDSLAEVTSTTKTTRNRTRANFKATFAVRHGDTVTVAGESPSTLRIGGGSKATRAALEQVRVGSTIPCFADPADPKRVVLTREIGAAYGFALIPLVGLILGVVVWRRGSR